jgi:bifunctional UDP-N-acetylglucosamine pyrophosphorylase/glucosamine-1-phosphate N-acetyltransferase
VRAAFAGARDVVWSEQREQLGTGHALACAREHLEREATVLVLSGDVPLMRPGTLDALAAAAERGWGAMAVATVTEPGSLGRVLARDGDGALARIVEASDASPDELAVRQVNAGLYALPAPAILGYLDSLRPDNAKGELYLTDAVSAAADDGHQVALVELADPHEAHGINDRRELATAHQVLVRRHLDALMAAGVTVVDPARTLVEPSVRVGRDTTLHPDVALLGRSEIGEGCTLHQGSWLRDSRLGEGVTVEPYSVLDGAEVAAGCRVGPFARLRPASVLLTGARVGNFVELKNATLGAGAKANHLAYLGDAEVGAGANVGAGVVTCNYDGERKHRTEIGDGAFVGSDTMLVAPVRVGAEASTAAGTVVTRDVPDGAIAVSRSRQKNVAGWSARRRRGRGAAAQQAPAAKQSPDGSPDGPAKNEPKE